MLVDPDMIMISKNITTWDKLPKKQVIEILGRHSRGVLTPGILKDIRFPAQMDLMRYAIGVSKGTKFLTPPEERSVSALLQEAASLAAIAGNRLHRQLLTNHIIDWTIIGFFALRHLVTIDSGHKFPVIQDLVSGNMYKAPSWVTLSNFNSWEIVENLVKHEATLTNGSFRKKLSAWVLTQDALVTGLAEVPAPATPDQRRVAFSPLTGDKATTKVTSPISEQAQGKKKRRRLQ